MGKFLHQAQKQPVASGKTCALRLVHIWQFASKYKLDPKMLLQMSCSVQHKGATVTTKTKKGAFQHCDIPGDDLADDTCRHKHALNHIY